MEKKYFTVTRICHRLGTDFMERGMEVRLEKEPDNKYDKEAIRVSMEALGQIGYVANSVTTVKGDTMSAGRLYDKIGDVAAGRILYVFPDGAVCEIVEE